MNVQSHTATGSNPGRSKRPGRHLIRLGAVAAVCFVVACGDSELLPEPPATPPTGSHTQVSSGGGDELPPLPGPTDASHENETTGALPPEPALAPPSTEPIDRPGHLPEPDFGSEPQPSPEPTGQLDPPFPEPAPTLEPSDLPEPTFPEPIPPVLP